jgi:tight adherence protein C
MGGSPFDAQRRRERQSRRQRLEVVLEALGARSAKASTDPRVQSQLIHAGFRGPKAGAIYAGSRIGLPLAIFATFALLAPVVGPRIILMGGFAAMFGWIAPAFYVGSRARRRMKDLQKALPDALDAMVVCVEAGLGLNQAMNRVADEIRHISTLMSDELTLTNLEIRAGTPREDALRNLGERTGLDDLRSLVTMLIQTDRFGTSIAQALRVQSDTLREKRKQRAEEAAAKTSIKMLFPLIFLIFPAMFVVTLGPPLIKLIENWGTGPVS